MTFDWRDPVAIPERVNINYSIVDKESKEMKKMPIVKCNRK